MILTELGSLASALALTDGTVNTSNVIDMKASGLDGFSPDNTYLFIQTSTAAGGGSSSTYTFNVIVSDTENLSSGVTVLSIPITGLTDARIATALEVIYDGKLPDVITKLGKRYFGVQCILANGNGTATLSVNVEVSPSKPKSKDDVQVVDTNVSVPTE
jgi:hypothetical protein